MTTIRFKLPKIEQVEFTIEPLEEHIHPEEQFDSGDAEKDAKLVADICEKSENNIWAWCCVKVTANYKGITGTDYLGCCSYDSEKEFKEKSGYYEDMKNAAFDCLIENLKLLKD